MPNLFSYVVPPSYPKISPLAYFTYSQTAFYLQPTFAPSRFLSHKIWLKSSISDPVSPQTEKGKDIVVESDVISLADIKPTTLNKAIEVKVYRKWI